jgi:ribosomal protein L21
VVVVIITIRRRRRSKEKIGERKKETDIEAGEIKNGH